MKTFKELYDFLIESELKGNSESVLNMEIAYDPYHLDCLLNPRKNPLVLRVGECDCTKEKECINSCEFDAISKSENGGIKINDKLCMGCSECINGCDRNKLIESTEVIAALKAVRASDGPAYAMIAPAFLGQFDDVTPGKLRTALKKVGFDGMLEVALFADILTLKEALEFDKNIRSESDFQLTSCCCPMWIGMIRKVYKELMPHVPGSVSPMVACARVVKRLHPDAITVFIGPCLAKKAEAREKDLVGDVDFVLTFQEVKSIFDALKINPSEMEEREKDHSSRAGRIYARTAGVSEAVEKTVERINPSRPITVRTKQADGVPACKAMMNDLLAGKSEANFYEGMGCKGGCVGGPRSVTGAERGSVLVDIYGEMSPYITPIENPYVVELLERLGIKSIEDLLVSELFIRSF